jgi:hypothetical protein
MGAMFFSETLAFTELHGVITQIYFLFTAPAMRAANLMHVPRNENCNNLSTIYFKEETQQGKDIFASLM